MYVIYARSLHLLPARGLDGHDLLRDHREHFDIDTVELVEACPRAWAALKVRIIPAMHLGLLNLGDIYLGDLYLGDIYLGDLYPVDASR